MTVTTIVSIKGAPGVTTLTCLIGATWPGHRRVAVVEADPFGGDLAARFRLPVGRGWTSFANACRRSDEPVSFESHLQALPGGLDVLIAARDGHPLGVDHLVERVLSDRVATEAVPWDLVIDGGRFPLDAGDATAWLDHSDLVLVVVRRDAASILKARDRGPALRARCGDRLRLIVVGGGRHSNAAIERFTGMSVLGDVPFDVMAAQVASGERGSTRHLSRSLLLVSARRLADTLAGSEREIAEDPSEPEAARRSLSAAAIRAAHRVRRLADRRLRSSRAVSPPVAELELRDGFPTVRSSSMDLTPFGDEDQEAAVL